MRLLIEDIKIGETEDGVACGPVGGNKVIMVKYNDGEKSHYITNVLVMGLHNFYLTEEDKFDLFLEEYPENDEFMNILNNSYVNDFYGFNIGPCIGDYDDIRELINNNSNNPASGIVKLLLAIYNDYDENDLKKYIGKYSDEVDIDSD